MHSCKSKSAILIGCFSPECMIEAFHRFVRCESYKFSIRRNKRRFGVVDINLCGRSDLSFEPNAKQKVITASFEMSCIKLDSYFSTMQFGILVFPCLQNFCRNGTLFSYWWTENTTEIIACVRSIFDIFPSWIGTTTLNFESIVRFPRNG